MTDRRNKIWSDAELQTLVRLRDNGLTNKAIAHRLGRTEMAVAYKLGHAFPTRNGYDRRYRGGFKKFTVALPVELYNEFDKLAADEGMPKTMVLRNAIKAYIDRRTNAQTQRPAPVQSVGDRPVLVPNGQRNGAYSQSSVGVGTTTRS